MYSCGFEDVAGDDVVGFGESFGHIVVGEEFFDGVVAEEFAGDAVLGEVAEGVGGKGGAFVSFEAEVEGADGGEVFACGLEAGDNVGDLSGVPAAEAAEEKNAGGADRVEDGEFVWLAVFVEDKDIEQ